MKQPSRHEKFSLSRLSAKLQHFRQQVLGRKIPHTLVSWRFLCPGEDQAVRLHRRVFLKAWGQHGRLPQYSILIYSLVIWYGWQSWRQIFRVWSNLGPKLYEKLGTPRSLQLYDLLHLSLLHGIPPIYYYRFRLFQQPPRKWLDFIYNHELPHWHTVLAQTGVHNHGNTVGNEAGRELIGNKIAFAKKMGCQKISVIQTEIVINRGTKPDPKQLFRRKKLFLKPNCANQCRNCYELHYDRETQDYELLAIRGTHNSNDATGTKELERIVGQADILFKLDKLTQLEDFLVQPLLANHPEIIAAFAVERLVTIRFITGHDGRKVWPLSANLEVPHPNLEKGWYLYNVDLENGQACFAEHPLFARDEKPKVRSFLIPDWPAAVSLTLQAHARLPGLPTVGWDIAITDCGPVIIEGNFNWGVNQAQILNGLPFLQGKLLDVYEKRGGSENTIYQRGKGVGMC